MCRCMDIVGKGAVASIDFGDVMRGTLSKRTSARTSVGYEFMPLDESLIQIIEQFWVSRVGYDLNRNKPDVDYQHNLQVPRTIIAMRNG